MRVLRCARDPLRRSWSMLKTEPRDPLRRSAWSKRPCCGAVRVCLRTGLWKLSRGLRACSQSRAVAGSIPAWSAAALLDRNCSRRRTLPQLENRTNVVPRSTRSTLLQLRLKNRNFSIQTRGVHPAAPAAKSQLLSTNVVELRLQNRNF